MKYIYDNDDVPDNGWLIILCRTKDGKSRDISIITGDDVTEKTLATYAERMYKIINEK